MAVRWMLALALLAMVGGGGAVGEPFYQAELIFPLERFHNHSSSIVECPNGDLLVCWFRGVGPEKGDDVQIMGARKPRDAAWSAPFPMADTPGHPDNNPVMFVDPRQRLWLLWPTLLANEWGTALMKYRISSDYQRPGPPAWDFQYVLHVTPVDFERQLEAGMQHYLEKHADMLAPYGERVDEYMAQMRDYAAQRLYQRLGWMTRVHPLVLPSGRLIVPLYTDTFSVSVMAFTDDWGETWQASQALVGAGNIQPSVVRRDDGTLVAMMRENGLQRRIRISESRDDGMTWGPVENMELPNPGASVEAIRLASGRWGLVYNDTEQGRHSLAVSLSEDEGRTWRWTRHLERNPPGQGGHSYPSVIQARDGMIHVTYSHAVPGGSAIKHAWFNEQWLMAGD